MKKIIYLLTAFTLVFTSCNQLDDVYEELDAQGQSAIKGEANFKMTEDDYALTGNEDVEKAMAFETIEQAAELIPAVLTSKYPVWGEGSSALVSFDYNLLNSVKNEVAYEITNDDYTNVLGLRFPNFGSNHAAEAKGFLAIKYPDAKRGDLVELTYKFYNGSVNDVTTKFVYTDEWTDAYEVTSDDYTKMGQRFSNFDNFEDARFKIGRLLGTLPLSTFAKKGTLQRVLYTYTYKDENGTRKFEDVLVSYTFDGVSWESDSNMIQFGFEKGKWAKDNTIKYTLTNADYALVGNDRFNNFDVRPGKDEETVQARVDKISTILLNNFPSDAEGQKYLVSYAIYNGTNAIWTIKVIKEGGKYILNE